MTGKLSQQVQDLLSKLVTAADQRGPQAAASFAALFAADAQFIGGGHALHGREEIQASREKTWNGVKSREHTIRGLYQSTENPEQFAFLGSLVVHRADAEDAVSMRICANFDVKQNSGTLEITRYEAFAEPPSTAK
ncbi:uncharacterized protein AB675_7438 [Cyphellophora attinorum]|uniref:Uncharacterized protein n=1 Tax=Cyphellophora attinorum TaxID=1664694 RepID=A0A0N1H4R9_9EURO|nr:uncharacterized protein AB675_7438 [Phialophora attinorum]KPI40422.1 hypothetical protein AB675_7438 [Phialophora attinorum]